MQIFDLSGRKVMEQRVLQSRAINSKETNVGNLKNGAYLLRMLVDNHVVTAKFIVRRE